MTTQTHTHSSRCRWNSDQARWDCPTASSAADLDRATTGAPEQALVDVRDMIVVHTALLREFRLAPAAVARVDAGAVKRAAVVDRHLAFLCDLLHHHHEGEDALLWPLLRERAPEAAAGLIDAVEAQHADIESALQTVISARAGWVHDTSDANRGALVTDLDRLYSLVQVHLDFEERKVLPLAATLVTDPEWHAIGDAAAAAMPKSALMLAFGMFAYEGDPAVIRSMLASAPAVPRLLVPRIGPRAYARRARRVHGASRP